MVRTLVLFCFVTGLMAADDLALLPKEHLIGSTAVAANLLAPALPNGGVQGNYKDAKGAYRLLLVRLPTNDKAAFLLLDVKKLMTDAHYVAHMGGYAGKKDGKPYFVFAKGPFLAVVEGKPERDADMMGRVFAARLPLK